MTEEITEEVEEVTEEPQEAPERPKDAFDEMSEEELAEAMRAAQERTRRYHEEEEARSAADLGQMLPDVLPTPEQIRARAEAFEREEAERERIRIEREPELRRIKEESWTWMMMADHARFAAATLDKLQPKAREIISAWAQDDGAGALVIAGGVGTGKSFAAFAVLREMYLRKQSVKFWPVPKLLDALRPSSSGSAEQVAFEASTVDVLVLDDIGAERPTDWSGERLYILVNDRWMARRRMIVTSNLDAKSLRGVIGERMYSRFLDGGHVLNMGMEDQRIHH